MLKRLLFFSFFFCFFSAQSYFDGAPLVQPEIFVPPSQRPPLNKTHSDGVLVGNGGGLAEMQALHLDDMLYRHLELYPDFKEFLNKINSKERVFLSFNSNCEEPGYKISSTEVSISSCQLYGSQAESLGLRPIPMEDIGAWVFAVRWLSVYPKASFMESYEKGKRIFENFEYVTSEVPFVLSGKHIASLIFQKSVNDFLFVLELKSQSINLTAPLIEQTQCESVAQVTFNKPRVLKNEKGLFFAISSMQWSCDQKSFKGDVLIRSRIQEGQAAESELFLRSISKI